MPTVEISDYKKGDILRLVLVRLNSSLCFMKLTIYPSAVFLVVDMIWDFRIFKIVYSVGPKDIRVISRDTMDKEVPGTSIFAIVSK